jgi:uncharacterized membrane protein
MNLEFRITLRNIVACLILYSLFSIPLAADAQVPLVPCTGLGSNPCTVNHLFQLLIGVYNFLLGLAALVAMLFIIWGGLRMLYFSYLEDSAHELESAKYTIRRAIGGFVIIALAYLLVNTTLTLLGVTSGPVYDLLHDFNLI